MKEGRKYEIKLNETKEHFHNRCMKNELKEGKSKEEACSFCHNQWHNRNNFSYDNDKFIYNSF